MSFKFPAWLDPYPLQILLSRSMQGSGGRALVWYHTLVLSAALGILYANLPIYLYILNPGLLPKYAFFGIFALIAPLVLVRYRALSAYLVSPFVLWATLLLVLNLIHLAGFSANSELGGNFMVDSHIEARRSLILTRAQYVLFSIVLGFAVYTSTNKAYLYTVVVLMAVLPCTVVLDFARPGLLYPVDTNGAVLGRAAAMFINPTMAGEAILHVFLLGCALVKPRYRVPLFFLAAAGILATFSRSSIIAWLLILPILVVRKTLPKSTLIAAALIVAVSLVFLGSFENYLQSRNEFDGAASNILSRLDFFSSFRFNDDSSEERADVIRAGWELFLQNPIFGAGAGATHFWWHRGSTHNQLLLLAAEYGIFGIGLWIWLLTILWKGRFFADRGLQLAMVFLFAFMSMFTHLMLDSASYWLATFALISMRENRDR